MEKCEISKIVAFRKKGEGGSPKRGSDRRNLLTLCQRSISFPFGKYLQVNCAHWNDNYRRLIYLAIIYQAEWQASRMCRQCKAGQHKFVITTAHDHYFALSLLQQTLAWSHCEVNGPIRLRLNGSEQQSLNILTMRIFAIKGWLISKSSNFKSNLPFFVRSVQLPASCRNKPCCGSWCTGYFSWQLQPYRCVSVLHDVGVTKYSKLYFAMTLKRTRFLFFWPRNFSIFLLEEIASKMYIHL